MTFDSLSRLQFVHLSCYAAVFASFSYGSFLAFRRGVVLPYVSLFTFAVGCMLVAVFVSLGLGNPLQAGMGAAFAVFYYSQR